MTERLVVLAPIAPAPTGNGLAMRAELFCSASGGDVQVVVVPVAGELRGATRAVAVVPPDAAAARAGARALLGSALWRERLERAGELPRLARLASPGLVDATFAAVALDPAPVALHVMRAYLAPLGVALAERFDVRWATLDLDEDDAAAAPHEAAAYNRLLGTFAPLFDGIAAASRTEADVIAARHELHVEHVPNAVAVPAALPRPCVSAVDGTLRVLFVGNLTYAPNVQAATALARELLPELRRRFERPVRVTLVGEHAGGLAALEAADVELTGFVPDLAAVYADADVVAVPLEHGAGTRIKLLEAFAHGVPVVASRVAAAGLDVEDGRHLLLADGLDEFAAALERVASDEPLARRLVDEACGLVQARYSHAAVAPVVRAFYARAAAAALSRRRG